MSITMGDGVTTIESSAFLGCSVLETVTISSSLESAGQSAFAQCGSIKGVYVTDVSAWCGIDFYDSDANPLSVAGSLYVKGDLMAELEIPSGVTAINPYAFYGCSSLTSVILPASVTEIGSSAFYKCSSLVSINVPDFVTSIGGSSFSGCTSLETFTMPDSVTSLGYQAFYGCSALSSVTIGAASRR